MGGQRVAATITGVCMGGYGNVCVCVYKQILINSRIQRPLKREPKNTVDHWVGGTRVMWLGCCANGRRIAVSILRRGNALCS